LGKKKTLYKALYGFGNSTWNAIGNTIAAAIGKITGMIIGMPISAYRINNWQS
jgi:hypothetical protein